MRLFQHKHLRKAQEEKNKSTFMGQLMSSYQGRVKKKQYFRRCFVNEHQLSCVLGEMRHLWKNHDQIVIYIYACACIHIYSDMYIYVYIYTYSDIQIYREREHFNNIKKIFQLLLTHGSVEFSIMGTLTR